MPRYPIVVLLLCCMFTVTGYAQQAIKATVYENKTRIPLGGIRIRNLNNKQNAVSDIEGKFSIKAALNDRLVFAGFAYMTDTVLVTDLKINAYFMEPQTNMLKEVKVVTPEANNGGPGGYTDPEFHGQSAIYQRNGDGSYKGGVIFRMWYWKKDDRKRKKREQKVYEQQVQARIALIFNEDTLHKFLPLKREEIGAFITLYTPTAKVFASNDFNLLAYLDSHYKQFMQLPPDKRVADKLKADPGQ